MRRNLGGSANCDESHNMTLIADQGPVTFPGCMSCVEVDWICPCCEIVRRMVADERVSFCLGYISSFLETLEPQGPR